MNLNVHRAHVCEEEMSCTQHRNSGHHLVLQVTSHSPLHTHTHITHHSLLSQGKFWYLVRTGGICRRYPVAGVAKGICFWEHRRICQDASRQWWCPSPQPFGPLTPGSWGASFVHLGLPPLLQALWLPWAFSFAGDSHSAFQQAQFGNAESWCPESNLLPRSAG